MTKRQNYKKKGNKKKKKKTKRRKDKRQRPKRKFSIVTSGQFCTLAMFFYLAVSLVLKRWNLLDRNFFVPASSCLNLITFFRHNKSCHKHWIDIINVFVNKKRSLTYIHSPQRPFKCLDCESVILISVCLTDEVSLVEVSGLYISNSIFIHSQRMQIMSMFLTF